MFYVLLIKKGNYYYYCYGFKETFSRKDIKMHKIMSTFNKYNKSMTAIYSEKNLCFKIYLVANLIMNNIFSI